MTMNGIKQKTFTVHLIIYTHTDLLVNRDLQMNNLSISVTTMAGHLSTTPATITIRSFYSTCWKQEQTQPQGDTHYDTSFTICSCGNHGNVFLDLKYPFAVIYTYVIPCKLQNNYQLRKHLCETCA